MQGAEDPKGQRRSTSWRVTKVAPKAATETPSIFKKFFQLGPRRLSGFTAERAADVKFYSRCFGLRVSDWRGRFLRGSCAANTGITPRSHFILALEGKSPQLNHIAFRGCSTGSRFTTAVGPSSSHNKGASGWGPPAAMSFGHNVADISNRNRGIWCGSRNPSPSWTKMEATRILGYFDPPGPGTRGISASIPKMPKAGAEDRAGGTTGASAPKARQLQGYQTNERPKVRRAIRG